MRNGEEPSNREKESTKQLQRGVEREVSAAEEERKAADEVVVVELPDVRASVAKGDDPSELVEGGFGRKLFRWLGLLVQVRWRRSEKPKDPNGRAGGIVL